VTVDLSARKIRDCGLAWSASTDDADGDGIADASELQDRPTPEDQLTGANDWELIRFLGPLNSEDAGSADGTLNELTEDEIAAVEANLQADLRCNAPQTGLWQIERDCTIWRDVTVSGSLRISAGAHVQIPENVHVDIDLSAQSVRIDSGGRLTVKRGGRLD
jgi:hypothetical protein